MNGREVLSYANKNLKSNIEDLDLWDYFHLYRMAWAAEGEHQMTGRFVVVLALASLGAEILQGQSIAVPETVIVHSEDLKLTGLVWRPAGTGRCPAVIFSHGNYAGTSVPGTVDAILGPVTSASLLGRMFAEKGYVFFCLFRRGTGLSKGQGESSQDLLLRTMKEETPDVRNRMQVRLLETEQLQDMISGVRCLKSLPEVDTNRICVLGHSFGGSLSLILAEHDSSLKAVIGFGAAAYSWDISPPLRARLAECVIRIHAPILLIHARNDYSTAPADSLSALMDRTGQKHSTIIYPPFGNSRDAGHNFVFLGIPVWERDVVKFLAAALRR